jgi:hypothetical protein
MVERDELDLEWVEIRVRQLLVQPKHVAIGVGYPLAVESVRRDVKIPLAAVAFLQPKGGRHARVIVELADELGPGVKLFRYQWVLIHGSTPSIQQFLRIQWSYVGKILPFFSIHYHGPATAGRIMTI